MSLPLLEQVTFIRDVPDRRRGRDVPRVNVPEGLAPAGWEDVPSDVAWRVEPFLGPAQTVALFKALSAIPSKHALVPGRVWAAMPVFVQSAVRSQSARAGDLEGWARAGLVLVNGRQFSFAPQWTYWRTLAKINPGCGWDFAVAAAVAGYSPRQAAQSWSAGSVTVDELRFLGALRD